MPKFQDSHPLNSVVFLFLSDIVSKIDSVILFSIFTQQLFFIRENLLDAKGTGRMIFGLICMLQCLIKTNGAFFCFFFSILAYLFIFCLFQKRFFVVLCGLPVLLSEETCPIDAQFDLCSH